MLKEIIAFVQESKHELLRVNWPTRQETARLTLVVVLISLLVAVILGFFDYIFTLFITKFLI
jgi:preprotein translocase subunit SecE